MTIRTRSAISLGTGRWMTEIRITTDEPVEGSLFNGKATICVDTGACITQTYADADQCRALERAFAAAAADLDTIAAIVIADDPQVAA